MLNAMDESEPLVRAVNDMVEGVVVHLKRGQLGNRGGSESLSTTAAIQAADLMGRIVRLFQEYEEKSSSMTIMMLRANYSAREVASLQVRRLLSLIGRTGDALLRAQFGTLVLMNVTRRVLSIIREAAANNTATETELEKEAEELLNELSSEDANSCTSRLSNDSGSSPTVVTPAMRKASSLQAPCKSRRGLSVRFTNSAMDTASVRQVEGGVGGSLMKRINSFVATEIPGNQLIKRAPSEHERSGTKDRESDFPVRAHAFYQEAFDGIEEFKLEMESMAEELCRRAPKQLHSSDTVITMGYSNTTRRYLLKAASSGHTFRVVLLEGAPYPSSVTQLLANALRERGIVVQTLPDSSAFAVMSMCTKVLVSAESVLANGGMLAPIGTHLLCVAAKHFAVPVLVATITLKMSPYYPSDRLCTRLVRIARSGAQEMPWSTYGSSEDVLPLPHGVSIRDGGKGFTVHSPITEYVPPELIALYATNETEFTPSQIHRIVRANYSDAD